MYNVDPHHKHRPRWPLMRVLWVALLAVPRCHCAAELCTSDAQCDATGQGYTRCNVGSGACICNDDRGCGKNEFCNVAGACQASAGCHTNDDCGSGLFCDVTTGVCVPTDVCGSTASCCTADSQCAFGNVCDEVTRLCVPGCRNDGDCVLGLGCDGVGLGRLGACGISCTSDVLCGPQELCNIAAKKCQRDTRGPYCFGCSGGVSSDDCGAFGNYCLLDTIAGGSYCGVDCSDLQACPVGYACKDVIILPQATLPTCALPERCTDSSCERTSSACDVDEDCGEGPPGSDCPRADVGNCETDATVACATDADCATGRCLKQTCRVREGAVRGICTCTKDSDCPRDRCLDASAAGAGHCELSGHACFQDADCDTITCVSGGCLLGRNCKPSNDRTCGDLQ